jgi:hypothetical protein
MFSTLAVAAIICVFVVGTALVVALAARAGAGRTGGTIARVLYDAEQQEKTR